MDLVRIPKAIFYVLKGDCLRIQVLHVKDA